MNRIAITPRQNWSKEIEALGFNFYKTEGIPYWYESAYYQFSTDEVDTIEAASNSLHDLFLQAVERIVSQRLYPLLGILPDAARMIEKSWGQKDPSLYGRFDLIYNGTGPPKLLEYNADTPTSLFESSVVQWQWKEQVFPNKDQFNSIHEALVARWRSFLVGRRNANLLHVTCVTPMPEDETTVQYIGAIAIEAGYEVKFIPIQDIGWDMNSNVFRDMENVPMRTIFKLYPWEWLTKEAFGSNIASSGALMVEPAWKMILSNKGILPILWEMFPDHENLLPTYRSADPLKGTAMVRKPVLGREGSNIQIMSKSGDILAESNGEYDSAGYIYQEFAEPPCFQGSYYPNIGSWIVNGTSHGMCIREDDNLIIGNMSRFVPHTFS